MKSFRPPNLGVGEVLAKSILDLNHPYFEKFLPRNDPQFTEGLERAKRLIEADHTACHWVVQPMGSKYPQCQNKIWKYDWAPVGAHCSTRKSWRLIAIIPEPEVIPYHIIAATVYAKGDKDQLSLKQLAAIFASVTALSSLPDKTQESGKNFRRVSNGDGRIRSLCGDCGESVSVSSDENELEHGENCHQCTEPI